MNRVVVVSRARKKRRADHGGAVVEEDASGAHEGSDSDADLISRLPDCVLGDIVGLLDTKEGARTAALSRRWRHVWRSAPLNLDDRSWFRTIGRRFNLDDRAWFRSIGSHRLHVFSQILAAHRGPARRLALGYLLDAVDSSRYDDWFLHPRFDKLQELVLHFPSSPNHFALHFPSSPNHFEIPATALRFGCLRLLDLDNCTFWSVGCSPAFPCLTYLSLRHVGIAEDLLHGMISNSPGIEDIVLDANFGHRRLRLSLPRLRCLAVYAARYRPVEEIELEEVVVEDAASLEQLLLYELNSGPSVRIAGPTKLKILGCLGTGFPIIQLGDSIFKAMLPVSLVNQFSSVTILALEMPEPKLKVIIGYLACFPCLEKLQVEFLLHTWRSFKCALRWDPFAPIECLHRSLKTIVLQRYVGLRTQVAFAKFFVKRARVLEVMKFCIYEPYTTIWQQKQHRQLNIKNRASKRAKFLFVRPCDLPLGFWMDWVLLKP